MTATHMKTPIGNVPIRGHIRQQMPEMTDREIARGLSGPGMHTYDTYRLIRERENITIRDYWVVTPVFVNQYKSYSISSHCLPRFARYEYFIARALFLDMCNLPEDRCNGVSEEAQHG